MIEYELIQQRQRELRVLAERERLVREAALAARADRGPGRLRRFAEGVRPVRHRQVRPVEC